METKEVIEDLRTAIKDLREKKQETIHIDALERYLVALEKDSTDSKELTKMKQERDLANFSAENERNIAHFYANNNGALEMFKSVILTGQSALKSCMLINGGAAVSLLAFISNVWKSPDIQKIAVDVVALPLLVFCYGVLAAAIASGTTYLCQFCYGNVDASKWWNRAGIFFHVLTTALVLGSYYLFGNASYKIYEIVLNQ